MAANMHIPQCIEQNVILFRFDVTSVHIVCEQLANKGARIVVKYVGNLDTNIIEILATI